LKNSPIKFVLLYSWLKKNVSKYDHVIENMMQFPLFTPLYVDKSKLFFIKHHFLGNKSIKVLGFFKGLINLIFENFIKLRYNRPFIVPSELTSTFLEKKNVLINPPGIILQKSSHGYSKYVNPTILYLGTLNLNRKKIDHLISSFSIVQNSIPNVNLIIAGQGPDTKKLKSMAKEMNIDFLSYVSEEQKVELLSKSWVFCSPSLVEGFGITLIEAGAKKLPVVLYDIGLKTVNSECSILCKVGDIKDLSSKLIFLLKNKNKRIDLGKKGYVNSLKFTWKKNSKNFIDFINENEKS
jgi:glycosyltransferase involved in cell wall biosynthesis